MCIFFFEYVISWAFLLCFIIKASVPISVTFVILIYTSICPMSKHFLTERNMSRVMRKPAFYICENKDADQLRGLPRS